MENEEYAAIASTLRLFYTFHQWQKKQVLAPKSIKYNLLSPADQALVDFYPALLRDLAQCIDMNQSFCQTLALVAAQDWGVAAPPESWPECSYTDYDKVRSTLLQMAREWSSDGAKERLATFGRLLAKAEALFPPEKRAQTRVLVPGCGLGRLVYEFVKAGFWTQGNEVSYHMLLALGFMLNRVPVASTHAVFPYVHRLSHLARRLFQVRPVYLPDESPYLLFENGGEDVGELMSMAAGSFVELYGPDQTFDLAESDQFRLSNKGSFDVVATCFFLDTAHNVLDYLRTIHHCLADSGVWINVGPLHWHFEGDLSQHMVTRNGEKVPSVMEGLELSREELFQLMDRMGFEVEEHESFDTTYSSDVRALSNFQYGTEFWVARKKAKDARNLEKDIEEARDNTEGH